MGHGEDRMLEVLSAEETEQEHTHVLSCTRLS